MSTNTDWAKLAEEFKANTRPHAGFFSWEGDKSVEEEGVLIEFGRTLQAQGALFFSDAFHRGEGNDPPDCEATGLEGERIGIELTELVDPGSAAAARAGEPYNPKYWSEDDIAAGLEQRISAKDAGNPKAGPYDEYILLIYTDEPGLTVDAAKNVVSSKSFNKPDLIDKAFLLISYAPLSEGYPCLRLNLGGV